MPQPAFSARCLLFFPHLLVAFALLCNVLGLACWTPWSAGVCCVVSLADGGREVGCGKTGWSETACKQGKEASNVLYIPSTPMCQQNAKYIAQQRKAFVKVLLCSALACEPDQKVAARRVWPREMLRCVCCLRKRRPDRACLWWGMSAFRHSGISAFHSG